MGGLELIDGYLQIEDNIKNSELPENEKLFLLSVIIFNSYSLIPPYIKRSFSSLFNRYSLYKNYTFNYLSTTCISQDEKSVGKFDFFKNCAKQHYNLLSESEKLHSIRLLNEVPKIFLQDAKCSGEVHRNIYNLISFFKEINYATNGAFKYDKSVFYWLLEKNKYNKRVAFFNALASSVLWFKKYFEVTDIEFTTVVNIENTLSVLSTDFNVAMAKSLLK